MNTRRLLTAVAICDALGAPYESLGRLQRRPNLPSRSFLSEGGTRPRVRILGGRADYGTFTDDTQIMLAVVDALRSSPAGPLPAYRRNLLEWGRGRFTVQGRRLDVGVQTLRSISRIKRGESAEPTDRSGNACLLIASAVHAERGMDEALIEDFVRTTHNSDEAVSSAMEFLRLVQRLNERGGEVGDLTLGGVRIDGQRVDMSLPTGYSVHTSVCALAALWMDLPMAEAVQEINLAGGDTDSIAAAYAVLATAAGISPGTELVRTMLGAEVIEAALATPSDLR